MPPHHFESEVESFLEGSHGDRTHIKRADHPRLHHYAGHYFRVCAARLPGVVARAGANRREGYEPGYRTLRVARRVTFRLSGVGKSVF